MFSSRIFRSRWSALFWAGGVVWFAYDVASAAPSAPAKADTKAAPNKDAPGKDALGDDVTEKSLEILANAMK